jgi:transposase, IS5 family
MSHRSVGQLSLADSVVSGVGSNASLSRAATAVDWGRFAALLEGLHDSRRGRPSYPPLVLFKSMVLQQWYRLSDPGLEEALGDRLSFRRFVGLGLQDAVPDHSTLCRFRHALERAGLAERLFEELSRQLGEQGLILKQGTLVDATVVQADAVPLPHERRAERSDPDAGFTLTRRGYKLGYKAHVAMDEGSRLIRAAVLTPANRHEADPAIVERLVQGDEAEMLADKGYDSRLIRAHLAMHGVKDGILKRRSRQAPLPDDALRRNAGLQPRRVAIESLFGLMKRSYGYARVRYRSLARNAVQLQLLCFAINLRRRLVLA